MADYQGFIETFVRNRSRLLRFRVKLSDTGANADITNYTSFRFTGKLQPDDLDAAEVFTKTLGAGIVKTDATNGLLQVTIAGSDTATLPAGKETHLLGELQCVADDGLAYSLLRGTMDVLPEISRTTP